MIPYVSHSHEVSPGVQHEVQLHNLITVPIQKSKHVVSLAHLVLLFGLLLFSSLCLLTMTSNVDEFAIDGMITLINNAISVFMFVVIS